MNQIKIMGTLLIAVTMTGCFSMQTGRKFDENKLAEIKKGETTRQQVISLFGPPQGKTINTDGSEILSYSYSEYSSMQSPLAYVPILGLFFMSSKGEMKMNMLTLTLKDNVVTSYSYHESSSGNNSNLITP